MPNVIPVKLEYAVHELWFDPAGTGAQEGDHVIVQTERGHEIGLAVGDAQSMNNDELTLAIGHAQLKSVLRICSDADLDHAEQLAQRGDEALPVFRRYASASGLEMKPVGVEFLFDEDKAVCYFAAEDRVDFRQLVRDLSRELHVRIDMRQIGVREEAAIVGGYGHCGQELCCRRFSTSFDPVSIRMAKEQDLPLNSTKISGACGRLMCCLRYEFEAYRDFKGRAPKRNAVIDTPLGKGKIVEYNTPKEQIVLRLEGGKTIRVDLADMTASEAACKKSQELGCACRPDTVTREVLEKLQSPDVQMALAELDRKNGVIPAEGPDASDIFVDTRKRRRERLSAQKDEGKAQGEDTRRRRGGENRAAEQPAAAQEGRRRKRRAPGDGGNGTAPAHMKPAADAAEPKAGGATRRRHHRAEGADEASEQERQQPRGGGMRPRRRRPGDKGGAAAQQQTQAPKQQGQGGQQAQGGQGGQGENKPRRRRRRRGNGGGQGVGNAPAAE
ncbi:regulatory iron-sulfur-containing complex subunit RicT [Paratractidigestivibacter sp.]|uniref:PSP1 domain-containing protein n=1 Tax=Paratractidigestivibacter sp. TaxID=2847316 RepID=UPI002ABDD2E3|nr:regulatory iron-sulfur-containing complex subunit RicT [Paratractidigestivibacter sp.]